MQAVGFHLRDFPQIYSKEWMLSILSVLEKNKHLQRKQTEYGGDEFACKFPESPRTVLRRQSSETDGFYESKSAEFKKDASFKVSYLFHVFSSRTVSSL